MIGVSVVSYKQNFRDGGFMVMVAGIYGTWYWFILAAVSGTMMVLIVSMAIKK